MSNIRYIFLTILALFFLALGGVFVKSVTIGPINAGLYRAIFAIPIFLILLSIQKNKGKRIDFKSALLCIISGIFLGADLALWNISFTYTTLANANLLANLVPLTVIPANYFIYKKKISAQFFLSVLISLIGTFILIFGKSKINNHNLFGDFLAFSASFFYGLFIVAIYKLRQNFNTLSIIIYATIGCVILLLPTAIIWEGFQIPNTQKDILYLLLLALFSQVIGQGGIGFCLGRINANLASLIVLIQPVIAACYGYLLFYEKITLMEMLGMLVTLLGIYIASRH